MQAVVEDFRPDRISPRWVPGHGGILGNEASDALALLGSLSGGDFVVCPDPSTCHLYDLINGWV